MAVSQRAPLREIVDLPEFRYGALLECGHVAKDIRHGQFRSRCQDCLRKLPLAIHAQRIRLMLQTQRRVRKKPWDNIAWRFSNSDEAWLGIDNVRSMMDIAITSGKEELILYTSDIISF